MLLLVENDAVINEHRNKIKPYEIEFQVKKKKDYSLRCSIIDMIIL